MPMERVTGVDRLETREGGGKAEEERERQSEMMRERERTAAVERH